ncbi:MAG: tail fiber protein [Verrucomicrobia bacterium]|nr:tail fiber protein [Verrucomicrobiota bacterium]
MKTSAALLILSIAAAGFTIAARAQAVQGAPGSIDYQGKALDATGNVLAPTTPTNYEMRFKIYDAQEGGAVIWSEKQVVTVSKGLFSVRLGEGTTLSPAEGTIAQSNLPGAFDGKGRFLGVTIVIPGQTPAEILPRLAFLGTPFAYVANKSISAERLVLASSTAAGSSVNLAQVSYVSQEVTATAATPSDTARSIVINSPSSGTTITLPGAMATRREYLVIKRDAGTDPDIVKAPAGGTLNGVTDGVIRLKVQGESVLVQSISANDWWVTADTRDKTPVGTIVAFAGDDTPPGYVWCNGASLSRTDARYIELFAKLSTASGQTVSPRWGYVDATTFRVPDLRGVFLRGVDSGRGQDPDVNSRTAAYPNGSTGGVVGSYQDSDTKAHQHNVSLSGNTGDVGGHNHGANANPGERGLIRRSASSDGNTTTDGADTGGRGNEPDVVNAPSAIPFDGGHNHSISLSGVSSATGGNESRPKNVYVHYFIKY